MHSLSRWSAPDLAYQGDEAVEAALRDAVRPDPALTVSEWADRYRMLSTKLAAEAGPYRTSRAPFLRDIMDALSPNHSARRVSFMKASQVGATEAGNNWLGFIVHWSPAPVMAVWPTVDTAKKMSKQRVEPLVDDSPELSRLVGRAKSRDSDNTQLVKSFPGGVMVLTGANSAVGLKSVPARYIFADEIDEYPGDVEGQGDPIELLAVRMTSFGRAGKMFLVSTPTVHGSSRIENEFDASDRRRYFVPCPHCSEMQWLKFDRLRWEPGRPDTVVYHCEVCERPIAERHKTRMMSAEAGAVWRPTAVAKNPSHIGFHISGLYSPLGWLSWSDLAREWEAAQGDTSKLKTFLNTRLGEAWVEHSDKVDWQVVYDRRESWPIEVVPHGATLLIGSVDVQAGPARLELHVWGIGETGETWAVSRHIHPGQADDPVTWRGVEEKLEETWRHESGAELRLDMLAVDTGNQTPAVYSWIAKQDQTRVIAVKGKGGFDVNAPVLTPTYQALGNRKRAIALRGVMVDVFKAELYRFLALPQPTAEEIEATGHPAGYVHVPDYFDAEWCKQLTAEQRVRSKTGRYSWTEVHHRNEVLDCRVYVRAAAWTMGVAAWRPAKWKAIRDRRGLDLVAADREMNAAPVVPPTLPRAAPRAAPGRRVVRSNYMG